MNTVWCKRVALFCVLFTLATSAAAQDTQRFEAFGGYSFLHDNHMLPGKTSIFNGWDGSLTVFLNHWLGVTSDFSGYYGSAIYVFPGIPGVVTESAEKYTNDSYTFLFGPHFVYRKSRYAPFAQTLFGAIHELTPNPTVIVPPTYLNCNPPMTCGGTVTGARTSDTNFAMTVGGGLDIDVGHGISIRPVQAEYFLRRFSALVPAGGTQLVDYVAYRNDFRYSGGVTFRFGPHLKP
jgi:Outer membrane protein beta-barrel domain